MSSPAPDPALFDQVVNLTKRRGFVFPSSEIYGGFRSTYDYGPIGVLLLRNVKDAWWRSMVPLRHNVLGLDAAILSPPAVWEASGHLANFTDPLVDCKHCKERFRPETAQGMFTNFSNVLQTSRKKPPFGIAQVGKSFRNEITPGNFVFRTREFEQMEMEFFVPPAEAEEWYQYWRNERFQWYLDLGMPADQIRLRPHDADELSHYSSGTSDVEFLFPWGWDELEGIANRGNYDLNAHATASGEKLDYFDPQTNERYTPHVIEPAAGATRTMMAFLMAAYDEEEVRGETRTVLHLHPRLAPYKVAVLPLSKKPELTGPTQELLARLQPHFMCDYDETQNIGKRYRRQDELGTPLCITFDFESVDDHAVTVRDRDTMEQDRVPLDQIVEHVGTKLGL